MGKGMYLLLNAYSVFQQNNPFLEGVWEQQVTIGLREKL
jgi:hypothetical protein